MPKFLITVKEHYTNTFEVTADDPAHAAELAEEMAIERSFPSGHVEECSRTVAVAEQGEQPASGKQEQAPSVCPSPIVW